MKTVRPLDSLYTYNINIYSTASVITVYGSCLLVRIMFSASICDMLACLLRSAIQRHKMVAHAMTISRAIKGRSGCTNRLDRLTPSRFDDHCATSSYRRRTATP